MKKSILVLFIILVSCATAIIYLKIQFDNSNTMRNKLKGELDFACGKDDLDLLHLSTMQSTNIIKSNNYSIVFPSYPSWSPDGTKIILSQYKDNIGLLTMIDNMRFFRKLVAA